MSQFSGRAGDVNQRRSMDVRLARPTDAPLALTLALDDRAHLIRGAEDSVRQGALLTALHAFFPLALRGRAWVGRASGSCGLLEATPRRYVIGWDITRLVIRGHRQELLAPLIEAAADHLRIRGVPRLFARCTEEVADELKALGFNALTREYVLTGPESPILDASLPEDSRYRMPQDAWPLHQLESAVTPGPIRQLEGLTSQEWSHRVKDMSEIVVEQDGRMVGWIGWGHKAGPELYQIGVLIHPGHRELAPQLVRHALQNNPGRRFIARVRDYQQEVLSAFVDAGFGIVAEELLLLRHARVELAPVSKRILVLPQVQAPTAHLVHGGRSVHTPTAS
jgi:hypothetical protein